jgi:hypothetical protein
MAADRTSAAGSNASADVERFRFEFANGKCCR